MPKNNLREVMTFAEAERVWGLAQGSIWNHVRRKNFLPGEAWQTGGRGTPWMVQTEAMVRIYGNPATN